MDLGLEDKSVLVTGSSQGIGKGIAEAFLKEKARVVVTGRNKEKLEQTIRDFKKQYGKAGIYKFSGDLGNPQILSDCAGFIKKECGILNHLVCNIGSGRSVPPLKEDLAEVQRMLDINFLSAVAAVQAMMPLLEKSASQAKETTTITFIGSICSESVLGCPAGYAAAKSALETYAKNIARPLGEKGIRVNTVLPGNINFPGSTWEERLAKNPSAVAEMLDREVPLKRLGAPKDVAQVVVFLASNGAKFVSGASWRVDGGQVR